MNIYIATSNCVFQLSLNSSPQTKKRDKIFIKDMFRVLLCRSSLKIGNYDIPKSSVSMLHTINTREAAIVWITVEKGGLVHCRAKGVGVFLSNETLKKTDC